jgi:hypothetical protein
MNERKRFDKELAEAVVDMLTTRNEDPSAEEIAQKHYGRKTVGPAAVEEVRRLLPRICYLIEKEYEQPVFLVKQTYYDSFRKTPPANNTEAGSCLAGGRGGRAAGIKLNKNAEDLIYMVHLERGIRSGAGKLRANGNRLVKAVKDGRFSRPEAAPLLMMGGKLAQPNDLKFATQVLKALPAAASDK